MISAEIQAEVLQLFQELNPSQQQRALDLVRGLTATETEPEKGSGKALLRHAGRISEEDGLLMEQAIEESCERIDPRDWELPS